MAGAMAEEGKSLSEIVAFLNTATSEMGIVVNEKLLHYYQFEFPLSIGFILFHF